MPVKKCAAFTDGRFNKLLKQSPWRNSRRRSLEIVSRSLQWHFNTDWTEKKKKHPSSRQNINNRSKRGHLSTKNGAPWVLISRTPLADLPALPICNKLHASLSRESKDSEDTPHRLTSPLQHTTPANIISAADAAIKSVFNGLTKTYWLLLDIGSCSTTKRYLESDTPSACICKDNRGETADPWKSTGGTIFLLLPPTDHHLPRQKCYQEHSGDWSLAHFIGK